MRHTFEVVTFELTPTGATRTRYGHPIEASRAVFSTREEAVAYRQSLVESGQRPRIVAVQHPAAAR